MLVRLDICLGYRIMDFGIAVDAIMDSKNDAQLVSFWAYIHKILKESSSGGSIHTSMDASSNL